MNLSLDPSVALGLTSRSQIARRVTERWAAENLFCLACPSDELTAELTAERANAPVQDFTCPRCKAAYQLKGKNGRHGNVVANSAFDQKIAAIREGKAPNYAFMDYDRDAWKVMRLFVVPGHFITESVVRRRRALATTARRAGWVGSNILLSKLPPEGRIPVISGGSAIDPGTVRRAWDRFRFLKQDGRASGGWGADVLAWVGGWKRQPVRPISPCRVFTHGPGMPWRWSIPRTTTLRRKSGNSFKCCGMGVFWSFWGGGDTGLLGSGPGVTASGGRITWAAGYGFSVTDFQIHRDLSQPASTRSAAFQWQFGDGGALWQFEPLSQWI